MQDAWDWYATRVLRHRQPPMRAPSSRGSAAPETVQGNILSPYVGMVDGLLVFLQFAAAAAGAKFVGSFEPTTEGAADPLARNIALTFAGFDALGLGDLADLPEEFREGMERRAPMLGDVGINNPYFWERPIARGAAPGPSSRVDLSTIHAVVIFQWGSPAGEALLEQTLAAIEGIPAGSTGVRILAEQRLHRNRPGATFVAPFGFVDGVSQPVPRAESYGGAAGDVPLGELLLGYENAKGENPRYAKPAVFRNGSFLAMRKIRQDVRAFQDFLDGSGVGPGAPASPEALAGKIMGRYPDGTPLALGAPAGPSNDFDYTNDPQGLGCPLSAHIRRANPRVEGTPRIMRRGFSYHERVDYDYEEGLVFMAYCASLSSQYEVVQKWVNGGNSTGTYGGQVDPMFAIPGIGDSAFIYPDQARGRGAGDDAAQGAREPEMGALPLRPVDRRPGRDRGAGPRGLAEEGGGSGPRTVPLLGHPGRAESGGPPRGRRGRARAGRGARSGRSARPVASVDRRAGRGGPGDGGRGLCRPARAARIRANAVWHSHQSREGQPGPVRRSRPLGLRIRQADDPLVRPAHPGAGSRRRIRGVGPRAERFHLEDRSRATPTKPPWRWARQALAQAPERRSTRDPRRRAAASSISACGRIWCSASSSSYGSGSPIRT